MNDTKPNDKSSPGDLIRILRRAHVFTTVRLTKHSPDRVGLKFLGQAYGSPPGIVVAVLDEPERVARWHYAVTPLFVGWVQDIVKDVAQPYNVELVERA